MMSTWSKLWDIKEATKFSKFFSDKNKKLSNHENDKQLNRLEKLFVGDFLNFLFLPNDDHRK